MSELPRGTVTFLFTDIEGSTRLLRQQGRDAYDELLVAHREIVEAAVAAHEGRVVETQGDSFFVALGTAADGVAAAIDAQRDLAAYPWPEGAEVKVRMGLHTGEPKVGAERYVGVGVHKAARIGAAGHGGQVLLSSTTKELAEEELPVGVSIRDLGERLLKDFERPERIFQLEIAGLESKFAQLKTLDVELRRKRRRMYVGSALIGVLAAAVAVPVFAFGSGGSPAGTTPGAATSDSLAIVDPSTGRLIYDPTVGATPTAVAYGEGAYWVTNADGDSVSKINSTTKAAVADTITNVGSSPSGITFGNGDVWVANSRGGTVRRIDAKTDRPVQTIKVGNGPVGIVYAKGHVWVANTEDGTITRIDASGGRKPKTLPIAATELAFGDGALWATQRAANQVVRIDPTSGSSVPIQGIGNGPTGIAYGHGSVWVANSLDGTVSRIDPTNNRVKQTISTGDTPTGLAVDPHGGVWVTNQYGGTLVHIDPTGHEAGKPILIGTRLQGIAAADGDLLVSADARPGAGHDGGTLKVAVSQKPDYIDPAAAYLTVSWPIVHMTNDGLVGFDDASGSAGDQLVPDLAVSLPARTPDGKIYIFRLRPNLHYSNGKPVQASDVRASLERFYRRGKVPVAFYDGIRGARDCRNDPKHCDLSKGIVTDDGTRTVTFHLVAADPEFLYKLALPFASVLPEGTPAKMPASQPVPATGPYKISAYRPGHELTLVRNPHFHQWSQAAQPDGYPNRIKFSITPKQSENSLINAAGEGRADLVSTLWTGNSRFISPSQLQTARAEFASQWHPNPEPVTLGLFLNTSVPPFNHPDVRRALNYAVDRSAAVQGFGGPILWAPTCQVLPPGFPGYRPYCRYTSAGSKSGKWTAPDLAKARTLVDRSGTRRTKVTVWMDNNSNPLGPLAHKLLLSLGYHTSIRVVPKRQDYFSVVGNPRNKAQIGIWFWAADYPAASTFFRSLFMCPSNSNTSEFCDPRIDRQIKRALALQTTDPEEAHQRWQHIDRAVIDQAPIIPLINQNVVDVVSKRVHNYQHNGTFGVIIDQLRVR